MKERARLDGRASIISAPACTGYTRLEARRVVVDPLKVTPQAVARVEARATARLGALELALILVAADVVCVNRQSQPSHALLDLNASP